MEYIGYIAASAGAAPLTRDGWLQLISDRSDLVRAPSRLVRNPATGRPIEARPPPDAVQLIRDDSNLGSFSWAQDDSASVTVMCSDGNRELMAKAAREFAQMIGGVFSEYRTAS
ncbi:MAG: hypothetical protein AAFU85_14930 [Planctomycetota bacterium]